MAPLIVKFDPETGGGGGGTPVVTFYIGRAANLVPPGHKTSELTLRWHIE